MTGFRRLGIKDIEAQALAQKFTGLPDHIEYTAVLAAFKRAAPALGFSRATVDAIDCLFAYTRPNDWKYGSRPIVWPSNYQLEAVWMVGRTQRKARIRSLIEAGLIALNESANGKRYGRRDDSGRIIEAFGIDLSPLAVRLKEFTEAAFAAQEERRRIAELRRQASRTRKALIQLAETASMYGVTEFDFDGAVMAAESARVRLSRLREAKAMAPIAEDIAGLQKEASTALEEAFKIILPDPEGPENRPPITTTTTEKQIFKKDTGSAGLQEGRSSTIRLRQTHRPGSPTSRIEIEGFLIEPRDFQKIGVAFQGALDLIDDPTWDDVEVAAFEVCGELGISAHAWSEALSAMGLVHATAALAVIDRKVFNGEIYQPGGYLRAMANRFLSHSLHLGKSLFGLTESLEPTFPRIWMEN